MRWWLALSRGIDGLNERVGAAVSWLSVAMLLLGALNAVLRYLGRFAGASWSSNAYLEAQWYLFSVLFLLGAGWTLRHDAHVRVDVLYGQLSARRKAWVDLIGTAIFLLPFCVFGLLTSWPAVRASWEVWEGSPDPGGLPRYPLKTLILVCFVLLFLQGVSELIKRAALLSGAVEEA
jgi:TRAP-type mannitol/chloroaromatic compound transport system permease small subunit